MQVFIPEVDPIQVAKVLDKKRLNKQIIECDQILKAISGESTAWRNHPVVKMYAPYVDWLMYYQACLISYKTHAPIIMSEPPRPPFIGYRPLHLAHRARLYQKDATHYVLYTYESDYTENNWYVDGNIIKEYRLGRLIKKQIISDYGTSSFTYAEQANILEHALDRALPDLLMKAKAHESQVFDGYGLCYYVSGAIPIPYRPNINTINIKSFIPLFTEGNACKYTEAHGVFQPYWWPRTPEGNVQRIAFLNLLIGTLKLLHNISGNYSTRALNSDLLYVPINTFVEIYLQAVKAKIEKLEAEFNSLKD